MNRHVKSKLKRQDEQRNCTSGRFAGIASVSLSACALYWLRVVVPSFLADGVQVRPRRDLLNLLDSYQCRISVGDIPFIIEASVKVV